MFHAITDKKWLKFYLDADKFALGVSHRIFPYRLNDNVWRFEYFLRHYEYCKNTNCKLGVMFWGLLLRRSSRRLGFSISGNCFGPGLRINHFGLIIVNAKCKIGKWCDIHQGVNIGENSYYIKSERGTELITCVPVVGNYVFIGLGAKIFGDCTVADNCRIGANCVINKSTDKNMVCYGNPFVQKSSKKDMLTIASKSFESEFLKQYPQYKDYLAEFD